MQMPTPAPFANHAELPESAATAETAAADAAAIDAAIAAERLSSVESHRAVLILGIESSCDETAAAVVADGRHIRSNIIASQADLHSRYGGVVPEIASRQHVGAVLPVIDEALREAGVSLAEIDGIAVTAGPGLVGALLVGVSAAKGIAEVTGKPLIAVHHIAGHIAANYLANLELDPPFLCLVVSGGHSHLVLVESDGSFSTLGRTRDDAAGEAFDKIARAVGLGYPGGPLLDKAGQGGRPDAFTFPSTNFPDSLDFSFSGLKTAALNQLNQLRQAAERDGVAFTDRFCLADFAASFQKSVADTLVDHTRRAARATGIHRIAIAGGVAANRVLRETMAVMAAEEQLELTIPPLILCTDNAAMIAAAGYRDFMAGRFADRSLNARSSLGLEESFR